MTEQGGTKQAKAKTEPKVEHVVKDKWLVGELLDSLNGPDEDEIYRMFEAEPLQLQLQARHLKLRRTLLYTLHRRDGANPSQAKKAADAMGSGELLEFFLTPEDPDADAAGEDEPAPRSGPTTTPASGSSSDSDETSTSS